MAPAHSVCPLTITACHVSNECKTLSLFWHRLIAAGAGTLDFYACTIVKPATGHLAPLIAATIVYTRR